MLSSEAPASIYTCCIDSCYSSFCIVSDNFFFKKHFYPSKIKKSVFHYNYVKTEVIQFSLLTELYTSIKISFLLLSKTNLPKDLDELHLGSITTKISYWQLKLPLNMTNFKV